MTSLNYLEFSRGREGLREHQRVSVSDKKGSLTTDRTGVALLRERGLRSIISSKKKEILELRGPEATIQTMVRLGIKY